MLRGSNLTYERYEARCLEISHMGNILSNCHVFRYHSGPKLQQQKNVSVGISINTSSDALAGPLPRQPSQKSTNPWLLCSRNLWEFKQFDFPHRLPRAPPCWENTYNHFLVFQIYKHSASQHVSHSSFDGHNQRKAKRDCLKWWIPEAKKKEYQVLFIRLLLLSLVLSKGVNFLLLSPLAIWLVQYLRGRALIIVRTMTSVPITMLHLCHSCSAFVLQHDMCYSTMLVVCAHLTQSFAQVNPLQPCGTNSTIK